MSLLKRFGRLAVWGGLSWLAPFAITLVAVPFLLSSLGEAKLGLFLLFVITPAVAAQLDFGLTATAIRRISPIVASGRVAAFPVLSTFAIGYSLIGSITALCVAAFSQQIAVLVQADNLIGPDAARSSIILCAIWLFTTSLSTTPSVVARAAQRMRSVALIQSATAIIFWGGALAVALFHLGLTYMVGLGILATIVSAAAFWWSVRDVVDTRPGPLLDLALLKSELASGSWFFIGQLCSIAVFQMDRVAVSTLSGPAATAAYALAVNVSNKLLAASGSLMSFLMPYVAARTSESGDELPSLIRHSERCLVLALAPTAIPVWLAAGPLILAWLGAAMAIQVAEVLRILWLAFIIPATTAPTGNAFLALGSPAIVAGFSFLTLCVLATLFLYLVPIHGATGAAFAFLCAMCCSLLFHRFARRRLSIGPTPDSARFAGSIIAGIAMQAAIAVVLPAFTDRGAIALVVVAILAWVTFYVGRAMLGISSPLEQALLRRALSMTTRSNSR